MNYINFIQAPETPLHLTDIYRAGPLFFIVCNTVGCSFEEEAASKDDAEFIGEQHEANGGNT